MKIINQLLFIRLQRGSGCNTICLWYECTQLFIPGPTECLDYFCRDNNATTKHWMGPLIGGICTIAIACGVGAVFVMRYRWNRRASENSPTSEEENAPIIRPTAPPYQISSILRSDSDSDN